LAIKCSANRLVEQKVLCTDYLLPYLTKFFKQGNLVLLVTKFLN